MTTTTTIDFTARLTHPVTVEALMTPSHDRDMNGCGHKWQDGWEVSINGQIFEFWMGLGHRKPKNSHHVESLKNQFGKNCFNPSYSMRKPVAEAYVKYYVPTPPTLDDVLYCLISDAEAMEMGFEDWCDNFGYSTDSMKAMDTYRTCQKNGFKLKKAGINIEAERDRLQDY